MRVSTRSALLGAISLLFSSAFLVAADETIALKVARLFDGKSKAFVHNGVVIVQGDKIVDAGSNLPVPEGARVIDLGDATQRPSSILY
jgi:imidazolonepropionase-like amidohydrolase